jgi:hypothetical protein
MFLTFGEEMESGPAMGAFSWLHTLWMFLGMEITTTQRAPVDRPTARRAARSLGHGDVSVVLLRRSCSQAEPTGEHKPVDWSCQWVVQGFWRHTRVPAGVEHHHPRPGGRDGCRVCGEPIHWVKPHLRGPEDKPLKASDQLFRLSR